MPHHRIVSPIIRMKTSRSRTVAISKRFAVAWCIALAAAFAFGMHSAKAQYPKVPADVKAEAEARKAAADKRSDDAWAKALPVIKEWEAKGKPYIPWAAE